MKFQQTYGLIEIFYLVDCTGSMDPQKKQAELFVQKSMIEVKILTQMILWSIICYQNKAELRYLGAYQQFVLIIRSLKVFINRWNNQITDKQTQFENLVQNCYVNCDAPCYGTKFHNFSRAKDEYLDDDLTNAI